ncbi:MAG: hypothetical protein ACKVY0_02615 [Prosthecobacter sp.]|uniref:hypothetical protein n=1 Tax=Prosthecobacter sp. TaxID=1965333 RepID=UPI0039011F9E
MKLPILLVASLVLSLSTLLRAQLSESRSWKDVTGRVIQAEFVTADDKSVTLKVGGKDFPLPLERLAAEDREWIKQKMTPAPAAAVSVATTTLGELKIAGVTIKPGVKAEFEAPLSETLLAKLKKRIGSAKDSYSDIDMTKAAVGLFVPANFDPAKSWPIMIVSVTDSGRDKGKFPSSVKSMGSFIDAAKDLGWVVLAADCPGNLTPGLPFNRCGLAEAGLEAMAAAWPNSKTWPIATGGFSGGAKYSGWLGGWFCEGGRQVLGMFMGGCNADMATMAIDEIKPPKKQFTAAKVFLSSGKEDKIAGPIPTAEVAKSLKRSGFDAVKVEAFDGGHEVNKAHVLAAMRWFAEPPTTKEK